MTKNANEAKNMWPYCILKVGLQSTVGGSLTNAKIPHLRVHKPKIAIVGSAVVKTVQVGDPLYGMNETFIQIL